MTDPVPTDEVRVRAAETNDAPILCEFNRRLAWETEGKVLDAAVLARGIAVALAEPDRLRYWVAEDSAGAPLGQAAVTREWSDWRSGWIWWLQSVYVDESARRRGVFRALFHEIRRDALAQTDVIGLRLYVEAANEKAQTVYQSLGMKPGGYHVFETLWPERYGRS